MRFKFPVFLLSAALVSSCAYEGTVVQKDLQPHPMYLSQGIEGKYTFVLQDKAGVRRRQMVTPDVYERYAIGEYFNDAQSSPTRSLEDGKAVKSPAVMTASKTSKTSVQRLATATKAAKTQRIASAKPTVRKHKAVAKRTRPKAAKKPVTVASVRRVVPTSLAAPVAPAAPEIVAPELADTAGFGIVALARCR